jgi:hypothetical protein
MRVFGAVSVKDLWRGWFGFQIELCAARADDWRYVMQHANYASHHHALRPGATFIDGDVQRWVAITKIRHTRNSGGTKLLSMATFTSERAALRASCAFVRMVRRKPSAR